MGPGEPRPGQFVQVSEASEAFLGDALCEPRSEKNCEAVTP